MRGTRTIVSMGLGLTFLLITVVVATCGDSGGGVYCCTYETRHTGCGGSDWTAWETEAYEFNIDDYLDDWTPERVCDKYTGSDTECGGSCCIYVEYQNNSLSSGACSGSS